MAHRDRERDRHDSITTRLRVARERSFFAAKLYRCFRLVGVSLTTGAVWYEYDDHFDGGRWRLRVDGHTSGYENNLGRRGKEYDGKLRVDGKTGMICGFHTNDEYPLPSKSNSPVAERGIFFLTRSLSLGFAPVENVHEEEVLSAHDSECGVAVWDSEQGMAVNKIFTVRDDAPSNRGALTVTSSEQRLYAYQPSDAASINFNEVYLLEWNNDVVWSVRVTGGVEVDMHFRGIDGMAHVCRAKLGSVWSNLSAHGVATLQFQTVPGMELVIWCQPERARAWFVVICRLYAANILVRYFRVDPVGDQRFHSAVVDNNMCTLVIDIETFIPPTRRMLDCSKRTLGEVPLPFFQDE